MTSFESVVARTDTNLIIYRKDDEPKIEALNVVVVLV